MQRVSQRSPACLSPTGNTHSGCQTLVSSCQCSWNLSEFNYLWSVCQMWLSLAIGLKKIMWGRGLRYMWTEKWLQKLCFLRKWDQTLSAGLYMMYPSDMGPVRGMGGLQGCSGVWARWWASEGAQPTSWMRAPSHLKLLESEEAERGANTDKYSTLLFTCYACMGWLSVIKSALRAMWHTQWKMRFTMRFYVNLQ